MSTHQLSSIIALGLAGLSACTGQLTAPVGDGSGGAVPPTLSGGAGVAVGPSAAPGTDPGRVTLHRLNRAEYNNTARDLFGTSSKPADDFPIDDRGSGFDNMADVLTVSPLHLSVFNSAARALISEALLMMTCRSFWPATLAAP